MFDKRCKPEIPGEVDESHAQIAQTNHEFPGHRHEGGDELFLVTDGRLTLRLHDRDSSVREGEHFVVARAIDYKLVAEADAIVLLLPRR